MVIMSDIGSFLIFKMGDKARSSLIGVDALIDAFGTCLKHVSSCKCIVNSLKMKCLMFYLIFA